MKHIIIGDLHGKDCWQEINIENYNKVVFLGDYVDSFTASNTAIYENLENIINLKKETRIKWFYYWETMTSNTFIFPNTNAVGFRPTMQAELTNLFNDNKDLFQIAY